jgi:hypothetical protein
LARASPEECDEREDRHACGIDARRQLFADLGFCQVRTLLNSGNVIFSVPTQRRDDVRARIETALASQLGLTCPVIILSADRVATNPSHLLVLVPQVPADLAVGRLHGQALKECFHGRRAEMLEMRRHDDRRYRLAKT